MSSFSILNGTFQLGVQKDERKKFPKKWTSLRKGRKRAAFSFESELKTKIVAQ